MTLDWFILPTDVYLETRIGVSGYLILALLAAVTLWIVLRYLRARKPANSGQGLNKLGILLLGPISAIVLVARFPDSSVSVYLIGLLPVMAAALWLDRIPAVALGFVSGSIWAVFDTGRLTQPFEVALWAAAVAALLRQPYRGTIGTLMRQPIFAALVSAILVAWPLTMVGVVAWDAASLYDSLDRALANMLPFLGARIGEGLVAGVVIWLLLRRWEHPVAKIVLKVAPWSRRLRDRLWFLIVPLAAVSITILMGLVTVTSYRVATRLVIDQMIRDAEAVSEGIAYFEQLGQSLIQDLAQDQKLLAPEGDDLETVLASGLQRVPYFEQLLYFDSERRLQAVYPVDAALNSDLHEDEATRLMIALEEGASAGVTFHTDGDPRAAIMSFITPVASIDGAQAAGALIGRTDLTSNPVFSPVIDVLQDGIADAGEGLIVDAENAIVIYPTHPAQQGSQFEAGLRRQLNINGSREAFRQRLPDGTGRLVYRVPIEGHSDWHVLILVPNAVALALAVQIALPTLAALLILILIALPLANAVMRGLTTPLGDLLAATEGISAGELDHPLRIGGEDEIGRLGQAFERMRRNLKRRQDEQDRLLRVTRSVASSLDLYRMVPPILSSALDVTGAAGVRITLKHERQDDFETYAAGEGAAAMAVLDQALMTLVQNQGTVVISQLERAIPALNVKTLPPHLKSLVSFPLRSDSSFHGILWLAYDHEHAFEQAELTFLSTLAGQAALAVANAQLFADAQRGRDQLQAVLESTTDAMIVTDRDGRVTLMNPAAERYFGLRSDSARGRSATEVIESSVELARLLANLQEPVTLLELAEQDGKTLLANTSTIVSQDGVIAGRVAVLHDISTLKELDNIKTVFLRMVSHDLRSPLTYMKGYLSMMPLSGELNEQQRQSLSKINGGIEQISELTERLLYLSRLQFGDEAELELALVDVEDMLKEIYQQNEAMFRQKGVEYTVEMPDKLPLVLADSVLYRQAIANLVTNALKFIPDGKGTVTIRVYLDNDDRISIAVKDNGIGIRRSDQARLFEAFFRVPYREGDPKPPRGSGLGLALVKAIADAHYGSVRVESEFGKGSTFTFTIPLRPPIDSR